MAEPFSAARGVSKDPRSWTGDALAWVPRRLWVEGSALLAFCVAILATNYALTALPNVKLFDLMVFVCGYTLGFRRAAIVAVASWTVYGAFNPWGATTASLLTTVAFSETAYALAGAAFHRLFPPRRLRTLPGLHSLALCALALASTLLYDVAANLYTGISWAQFAGSSDYARWIMIALFNPGALWFSAMHVGSNVVFFSTLAPVLIKGVEKARGLLPGQRGS